MFPKCASNYGMYLYLHFARVADDTKFIVVTSICVSVCLSVRGCTTTLLHGPGCNLGAWQRLPPSCALLGGFAIGARVALLWQHNANPSYKLASIPRYDDIVRTAGWAGTACAAGHWLAGDGCVLKIVRRICEVGVAGSLVIGRRRGAFSTLLRWPGLRASSDGVLATKSELKMLASTCLYSLYAWLLQLLSSLTNDVVPKSHHILESIFFTSPWLGCKVLQRVCLFVSVCSHVSKTRRKNFTKFSVC